ncbi:RNA polymerase sigma factor [Larkinella soli]|uniref:RNA polymerase sigma factor n=1 Tax=Larkinella soli TaxID=1770527 RepID=UPI0013E2C51F|nr:RNA polymerase sigma-70 factor [Larkinella soli]
MMNYLSENGNNLVEFSQESELADGIACGDERAFRRLYHDYYGELHRFVLRFVRSAAGTEDVLHDVFLKVWESRLQLDPTQNLRAYLYRVCKNQMLNDRRRAALEERYRSDLLSDFESLDPTVSDFYGELEPLLDRVIGALPSRRQTIFRLCKLEGCSYEEVARRFGISRGTVNDHIVKANVFIRREMEKLLRQAPVILLTSLSLFM